MNIFENHYFLTDIDDAPGRKNGLIAAAINDDLPLAIWAASCLIGKATKGPDGRRLPYEDSEMEYWISDGEWLYIAPAYISLFKFQDQVAMGFFRSSPESPIDRWATRGGSKIFVSLSELCVPEGLYDIAGLKPSAVQPADVDPDTRPTWILREISGGRWECGDESAPEKLKGLAGFSDIVFAIKSAEKEFSAAGLPGVGEIYSEEELEEEGLSYVSEFGADDMADDEANLQYKEVRRRLIATIEAAEATGNSSEMAKAKGELADLDLHLKDMTRPGGKPQKLDGGDPVRKEGNKARDRKRTVLKNLRDAGQTEMADHLEECYLTGDTKIIYTNGSPYPIWITK